jgi:uncharacterized membrane protein
MADLKTPSTAKCNICGKSFPVKQMLPAEFVRNGVAETIKKDYPDWVPEGYVCLNDLNYFRGKHMEDVLEDERGEVSKLEKQVIKSLKKHELISENINAEFDRQLTFGERIADKVAEFGGSWRFIIIFGCILLFWIALNSLILLTRPFDPYPYILLNLVLSCLAAIQAPIIMMSQNRQEDKDRMRAEHDYRVNLKAELEIRHLNEKMDHLLQKQWHRLLEIQQIQLDLMEELTREKLKRTITPTPSLVPAQPAPVPTAPTVPEKPKGEGK